MPSFNKTRLMTMALQRQGPEPRLPNWIGVATHVGETRPKPKDTPTTSSGTVAVGSLYSTIVLQNFPVLIGVFLNYPGPRNQMDVPISLQPTVDENTLFEDPLDSHKKFALPEFKLAQQSVSGVPHLRVSFEPVLPIDPNPENQIWQLTVRFRSVKRYPEAAELPHNSSVWLQFTSGVKKELAFTVEPEDATTLKATLQTTGLNARDEIVSALEVDKFESRFIVRCSFSAAVLDSEKDGVKLYRKSSHTVDIPLDRERFIFNRADHPYIFAHVGNISYKPPEPKLLSLLYKGRYHDYIQDGASKYIFYYLPDYYKLTRRSEPPFAPQISIHLDSEGGSLKYVAAPVWDSERLKAASQDPVLRNELPNPLPSNITGVVFMPLIQDASQLTLKVSVPRKNVPSMPARARPGVVKNLTDVFLDEIHDLSIDNLSEVLAALLGKEFGIFTGNVEVAVSGTRHVVSVPFSARLNDLYGSVLEDSETPGENGGSSVRLRNVIESPVTVRSIPVHISRAEDLFPAHIENLAKGGAAVAFPVDLAPGEELSMEVVPDQPLPAGSGSPDALFDLDDIQVNIDAPAVWNAILDTSVQPQHTYKITVQTFADAFVPNTDVQQVSLDFENGNWVVLDPEHLQGEVTIRIPVKDLILAQVLGTKVVESEYSYKQSVKRTSSPWPTETKETGSGDLLHPVFNL